MSGLSSFGEALVLAPLTTNGYVSLHLGDPGNTGANEIVGAGYARQGPVAFTNSGMNPTIANNNAIITFPVATANYGSAGQPVNFFGFWDAQTGGNFRGSGPITLPIPILSGDSPRFYANTLSISVD